MNKKIPTLLLTAALALTMAGAAYAEEPASSAESSSAEAFDTQVEETPPAFYPADIDLREDGEQMLIVKRYIVPAGTAVSELKENDLTRMGSEYVLWGVSETQQTTKIEEAELTKTLDVAVPSNIPEEAVAALQQDVVYDQDGYLGTLHLDTVTCGDEMREDGTYPATAMYAGTVTRVVDGDLVVELIYAPVQEAAAEPATAPQIPTAPLLVGGVALLAVAGTVGYMVGKKQPNPAPTAEKSEEKPKVYVPANDIVVGAHEEGEDDD